MGVVTFSSRLLNVLVMRAKDASGYLLLSTTYDSFAVAMERMSALQRLTLARICASRKLGTAIAASIAMIATTISNSISVKARCGPAAMSSRDAMRIGMSVLLGK